MTRWRAFFGRLWPRTLTGQMILLVVLALLLAMALNVWVLSRAHQHSLKLASERFLVRQFSSLVLLLEHTPAELHEQVLSAWRQPRRDYGFSATPVIEVAESDIEQRVQGELLRQLGSEYRNRVRVDLEVSQRSQSFRRWQAERHRDHEGPHPGRRPPHKPLEFLLLSVQMGDGRWFSGKLTTQGIAPLAALQTLTFLAIAAALVLLVVIWQLRRITRPLRDLREAASDFGRGQEVAPLVLRGPQDIQDAVSAFNTMNERVRRFVTDRTRMLAALSHDLRTPMTSMRLRLELMPAGDERDKLIASLEEMQQMAEATLSFVRQAGDQEPMQTVDINGLLGDICEEFTAMEANIEFHRGEPQTVACRPVSLKRALRNLVDNAVIYGAGARVSLTRQTGELQICIRDQGPGIPTAQLDQVFDPYYRLESSRNRDTGGVGLGLSIARQIIQAHGGRIQLRNCDPGLEVSVYLPLH